MHRQVVPRVLGRPAGGGTLRVILTGFRGTGKTQSGKLLARLLGVPFFDTDQAIEERAKMPVHDIFTRYGEEEFRRRECSVIRALPETTCVVGTGGGAILDPGNVANLRRGSTVFLLTADPATIERRIAGTERPPLTKLPLREEIRELLLIRKRAYLSAADFCIDTEKKSPNEVAFIIQRILAEGTADRRSRESAVAFLAGTGLPDGELDAVRTVLTGHDADPLTRLYGIAGNPCAHSKSPGLFNRLFPEYGINAHYTRFCWPDLDAIVRQARLLDCRGLSVTIPFKEQVTRHCQDLDDDVKAIGAANTVVFCGGRATASNTDWIGIRDPLLHRKGANAVILGAGGAAAAAAYALRSLGMEVTVLNRTVQRAEDLALRFGCRSGSPDDLGRISPDVIVQTTPVGMAPDDPSLVNRNHLVAGMTVFDLVYTPPETRLIRDARAAGCEAITGTELFARQAREQFRIFTGIDAPLEKIREMVS